MKMFLNKLELKTYKQTRPFMKMFFVYCERVQTIDGFQKKEDEGNLSWRVMLIITMECHLRGEY